MLSLFEKFFQSEKVKFILLTGIPLLGLPFFTFNKGVDANSVIDTNLSLVSKAKLKNKAEQIKFFGDLWCGDSLGYMRAYGNDRAGSAAPTQEQQVTFGHSKEWLRRKIRYLPHIRKLFVSCDQGYRGQHPKLSDNEKISIKEGLHELNVNFEEICSEFKRQLTLPTNIRYPGLSPYSSILKNSWCLSKNSLGQNDNLIIAEIPMVSLNSEIMKDFDIKL